MCKLLQEETQTITALGVATTNINDALMAAQSSLDTKIAALSNGGGRFPFVTQSHSTAFDGTNYIVTICHVLGKREVAASYNGYASLIGHVPKPC